MPEQKNYLTVNQATAKYPFSSHASMRYNIFNAEKNGLHKAILRVGRKVLIDEEKFLEWLESHREGGAK
jgi:hypothetical protein